MNTYYVHGASMLPCCDNVSVAKANETRSWHKRAFGGRHTDRQTTLFDGGR